MTSNDLADRIIALAEINSGSFNPEGVNRCGERLVELLEPLRPDRVESIEVPPTTVIDDRGRTTQVGVGRALRVTKGADSPFRVCLFGHLDTVFPADSDFQAVTRDGDVLRGPGVADCKGGLILATEVARSMASDPRTAHVGWQMLVLPDEEIGSASSAALLAEAAEVNDLGVGFEPALPSGGIAGARKGTLTAHTIVTGQASHVGRAHHEGRSAILALARLIDRVEALNRRPGLTVSTGRISGGGALNVVPDRAVGSYNLRVETLDDRNWAKEQFAEAVEAVGADVGVEIDLLWANERPPKVRTPELDQLLADVTEAAAERGLTIMAEDTGGCCDGNNLAAAGLPNVDSLGIAGGGIHSSDEFADVASIPQRVPVVIEMIARAAERNAR